MQRGAGTNEAGSIADGAQASGVPQASGVQWAEMLDTKTPVKDFHQRIPDMALRVSFTIFLSLLCLHFTWLTLCLLHKFASWGPQ